MIIKKGIAASLGISIGKAYVVKEDNILIEKKVLTAAEAKLEVQRFKNAIEKTKNELSVIHDKILAILGKNHAKLIDAHRIILKDPLITKEVPKRILSQNVNAEFALTETLEETEEQFSKVEEEYFQERKYDVFDVGKKILFNLIDKQKASIKDIKEPVIIVAHSLYPSDTLLIKENGNVQGFCMDLGSKSSHTSIFAQSMGLSAVVGLSDISSQVKTGDTIIVDGEQGVIIISPTQVIIDKYKVRQNELKKQEAFFQRLKGLPAITRDNHVIDLFANLDSSERPEILKRAKADGVGLFRTESLFMNRQIPPSEEEQYQTYLQLEKTMPNSPVIIRTADIGGDRVTQLGIHGLKDERNPFMGFRGIRLSLKYPDLLKTQLRAIYRANVNGNLSIMIPMLTSQEELITFKKIAAGVYSKLYEENKNIKPAQIGIMVEIPSAAIILDQLLPEIDFVSIGTNDLVQYTLAVDRINQYVSELYEPLHPAVLRLIHLIVQTAHKKGKKVGVCGEMASDPFAVGLLIGLGVDSLSVPHKMYLRVKYSVRTAYFQKFAELAMRALDVPTAEQVRALVEKEVEK